MTDNIVLNEGTGGATLATDDDGTAHHQYVKVEFGADNTQTPVSASNPLPVDGSGVTQPVSGSVSVSGTVTANLSATDNAVLDTIDAVLDAINAKLASGTVIGDVNLGATDNAVLDAIAAAGAAIQAAVEGTLTVGSHAVTNAGTFAVQVDAALPAGTNAIGKLAANSGVDIGDVDVTSMPGTAGEGAALPSSFFVVAGDDGTDTHPLQLDGSGHLQVDLAADSVGLAQESGGNLATLAGAVSGSEMQVDVVGALPAGTNAIGKLAANSGVDIGDVDVTSVPQPSSHYRNIDANAEDEIKGSGGTLYWLNAINLTAAVAYLHLYDATAASVTPGTTTPNFTFAIPTQGDTNGAGFNLPLGPGQVFANGITLVCTTTLDGSAGDPGANGVIVNAGFS